MLGFFQKPPAANREALLAALPVRNELVREKPCPSGLRLIAPLNPNPLRRVFAGKNAAGAEKIFELDELGAWVWGQVDGRQTVEQLIEAFAKHFRVNLREAEVSVLAFLKTLTQRNLIAHVAPKPNAPAASRRKTRR